MCSGVSSARVVLDLRGYIVDDVVVIHGKAFPRDNLLFRAPHAPVCIGDIGMQDWPAILYFIGYCYK